MAVTPFMLTLVLMKIFMVATCKSAIRLYENNLMVMNGSSMWLPAENLNATSIWHALDFDVKLRNDLTRWRRYYYSVKINFKSLLALRGDVNINGPSNELKIVYFNARSLMNKIGILEADVFAKNFDIIAVSETHLDDSINSAEIFPPEYIIYHRDRDRNGGGVLIAVKGNILSSFRRIRPIRI